MSRFNDIYTHFLKNTARYDITDFEEDLISDANRIGRKLISEPINQKNAMASRGFRILSNVVLPRYTWELFHKENINNQMISCYVSAKTLGILPHYYQKDNFDKFSINTSEIGLSLMILMACNQFIVIDKIYDQMMNSIIDGTAKKSATYDNGAIDVQKMFVLAIEMLSSERKNTVDWAAAGIPIELFYCDFVKEALYSTDDMILTHWLNGLCEQHLKWCSRAPEIENEATYLGYEIPDELHLWPFEYHAVVNLRARRGLSTPAIEHPLLTTAFKNVAIPDFSQWKKPQWFTDIQHELVQINTDLAFTRELF